MNRANPVQLLTYYTDAAGASFCAPHAPNDIGTPYFNINTCPQGPISNRSKTIITYSWERVGESYNCSQSQTSSGGGYGCATGRIQLLNNPCSFYTFTSYTIEQDMITGVPSFDFYNVKAGIIYHCGLSLGLARDSCWDNTQDGIVKLPTLEEVINYTFDVSFDQAEIEQIDCMQSSTSPRPQTAVLNVQNLITFQTPQPGWSSQVLGPGQFIYPDCYADNQH